MDKLAIALSFLEEIKNKGYVAYIIGGATRDYLLNKEINDIDITTNMPIDLINECYKVSNKHAQRYLGTTIIYKDLALEITHFRRDLSYSDHRHPLALPALNLKDDLKRRDFRVNALALDYKKRVFDLYHGLWDLKNKRLTTIGRATRRFNEDALRILRGIYFSLRLDFKIEAKTLSAMRKKAYLLADLQRLTLLNELVKIFSLENKEVFNLFRRLNFKKNLSFLKAPLYYLERDNYYPKDLFELIYLISYYNRSLLEVNIKKEWKKSITKVLSEAKEAKSTLEVLGFLGKGD